MNTDRSCGCKSFRSCYICEKEFGIQNVDTAQERVNAFQTTYKFCLEREMLFPDNNNSPHFNGIRFPGVKIYQDFISIEEETQLIQDLDDLPWDASQSGRRKQNFGPKANFNKRKAKIGDFHGFPLCTKFIQDRFASLPCLKDYKTVEQCSIEYRPETGSRIDPHIDDCWIWGERIVQLNLLSDSYLTCLPYLGDKTKYNLPDLSTFPKILDDEANVVFNPFDDSRRHDNAPSYSLKDPQKLLDGVVKIPLPRRSLLVFFGEPRYDWEHCILRRDISQRRIVIAYREFTPPYLPGGVHEDIGREILNKAKEFW